MIHIDLSNQIVFLSIHCPVYDNTPRPFNISQLATSSLLLPVIDKTQTNRPKIMASAPDTNIKFISLEKSNFIPHSKTFPSSLIAIVKSNSFSLSIYNSNKILSLVNDNPATEFVLLDTTHNFPFENIRNN